MFPNQPRSSSSLLLQRINLNPTTQTTTTNCKQTAPPFHHETPLPCTSADIPDAVSQYHTHLVGPNQCCSAVIKHISAPITSIWPVVRRFDNPQAYKHFVKSCHVIIGDGNVGTLREIHVISGLPAANSTEKLEILDDENHVISFSVVSGDHRLANYRSVTSLHGSSTGKGTVVVESYVVDIPPGNNREETCTFVDTIVKCNLHSLAQIAQNSTQITPS